MVKKALLGCSALVVLVVVGIAVVVTLNRDTNGIARGTDNETHSLSQGLEQEFGGQPQVELVCRFPVVGIAPCIPNNDMGSREVTLTFTNYVLPKGVTPEEQARRIAILAFKTSVFVRESDKTEVIFEEGSESASVSRRYSFSGEELAAGEAPSPEAADDGKAAEE